jgi:glycine/D-amino acid oxidase-like deaminating enzyme/nitrite reductase/ring-hydroxylating ferredoxin subunit
MKGSVWIETGPAQPAFPELDGDVEVDVVVIGGGIVGITTALLLTEAGARVAILEADRVAHGVTGHTTAKVTSQHGLIYDRLRSRFGLAGARIYGDANETALGWIADRVERDGIECDFRRRYAYAYAASPSERSQVQSEAEAAAAAGLPARMTDIVPLPFAVHGAVRFDDQAEFHVRRYLLALLAALTAAGCRIFERTRAVEVDSHDRPAVVKTPGGRVVADQVVVATHYPFLDRSLAFARVHPERSYAIVCRIAGTPPDGMLISAGSPTRSVRAVPVEGEELLLVGGEGHRTGTGGDTEERYQRLEEFAREHWDVRSVDYRWSAQDNTTVDGVPYVGRLSPREDRVFMATGFAKWGMTGGTAAALLLTDLLLERESAWAPLFDPNRLTLRASAPRLVKENLQAGLRFVGDRVTKPGRRSAEDLLPGEGDIARLNDERVAAYRDEDGTLHAVSPTCTHLGCQVNFNAAERTWDCPCHGSRFARDGSVLQGPAVHRLERKPVR